MKPKLGVWWNRRGASTLEYIVVISAVLILAMALYHTFGGSEVTSAIKERVQAAIQGESTGVATEPSGKETSEKESEPKKENASSQIAQSSPKEEKEESKTVKFLKGVGKVGLDFVGYYDAKAAITGVDEDGNKIGVGERILRGAMVIPVAKPVKGAKMAYKYGSPALKAGKKNLDKVAKRGKKTACGCPKKVTVDDLLEKAKPLEKTKGKSVIYKLHGGYDQALRDYDLLNPKTIRETPELKIGVLEDGRTVIARKVSDDGRPTLEIQTKNKKGKVTKKIKFRYEE